MKKLIILLIAITVSVASFVQKAKVKTDLQKTSTVANTIYSCPMHPSEVGGKPRKCSKCRMDLALSKKEQIKTGIMKSYNSPKKCSIRNLGLWYGHANNIFS